MGLGFSFFGEDNGLSKTADHASERVTSLMGSIQNLADSASKIGELTRHGQELTTGFEAQLIASNAVTTRMGANLGKSGEDLKKFSKQSQSLAFEMNRDVSQAAEALGQYERAGKTFSKGGIDSAKTLLKLAEVSGTSAQMWADSALEMQKTSGMSSGAIQEVMDSATAFGKATGNTGAALQKLPALMKQFSARAAALAKGLPGVPMEEFGKQVFSTATSVQKATGMTQDAAQQFSLGIGDAMLTATKGIQDLGSGVGDEVPKMFEEFSIATGDSQEAFKLMKTGPEGFMKAFRLMTKGMNGDKDKIGKLLTFIGGRMGATFGPEMSDQLVNYLSTATDATDKQGEAVKHATGDLQKYAKEGFKPAITNAALLDRAMNILNTRFRGLAKSEADTFVAKASKNAVEFGNKLTELVKKGGPLGKVIETAALVDQLGVVGFLPESLQQFAPALGLVADKIGKLLPLLPALISGVGLLFGPAGLLLVGAAAVLLLAERFDTLKKSGLSTTEAIKAIGKEVKDFLGKAVNWAVDALVNLSDTVAEWVDSVDWEEVFSGIITAVVSLFDGTSPGGLTKTKLLKIFDNLYKAVSKIGAGLIAALGKVDWRGVWNYLGAEMGKLWDYLVTSITGIFAKAGPELQKGMKNLMPILLNFISDDVIPWLKEDFPKVLGRVVDGLGGVLKGALNLLRDMMLGIFEGIGDWIKTRLPQHAEKIEIVLNVIRAAFETTKTVVNALIDAIGFLITKLVSLSKYTPVGMLANLVLSKKATGEAPTAAVATAPGANQNQVPLGPSYDSTKMAATSAATSKTPKQILADKTAAQAATIEATHYPKWFGEYKPMFKELLTAVKALQPVGTSAPKPVAQSRPKATKSMFKDKTSEATTGETRTDES